MRFVYLALAAAAAPLSAQSAIQPILPEPSRTAQGDVALTIYNNDLALVQDIRRLPIGAGRSRLEFPDVSGRIRAETVSFAADDAAIVEQNFDYDLLSPTKLMEKAVGRTVTLVRMNPATGAETREEARVLATNGGVVLQIGSRIEVLRDDGLPVRVIFDKVPENLRARPTLSVTVQSGRAGTRPASLTYLTPGLGWKADYVTLFDEAAGKIDVQGWITLNNTTGTSFHNAEVVMVAGQPAGVRRTDPYGNPYPDQYGGAPVSRPMPGTESGTRGRLGDFYLYPLKGRTTVANAQTKQVSFLDVQGAPAVKSYEYKVGWLQTIETPASASTVLKFSNSSSGGLGDQLPAGVVRVYIRDARGQPQFIGESNIGHTPMGSELALRTGDAFDVKVATAVVKRERITSDEWERSDRYRITKDGGPPRIVMIETNPVYWRTTMAYTLTNARPAPVTVDLLQAGLDNYWHDTRVVSETVEGRQRSLDERLYSIAVPANGKTVVTVTYETRA
jgi:hypothetical protein